MPTLCEPFSVVHLRSFLTRVYFEPLSEVSRFGEPYLDLQSHHQHKRQCSPRAGASFLPAGGGRGIIPLLPGVGRTVGTLLSVEFKGTFLSPLLLISRSNPHLLLPSIFSVILAECPPVHQTIGTSFSLRNPRIYRKPLFAKSRSSSVCILTLPRASP
jgi:hypothetical protein